MSTFDIIGIALLGFILTLITITRVKQEINKQSKKIESELAEIKAILKARDKS